MYRAVILDIDGTLVASNDAHARAWVDALTQHGYSVPFERVRQLIGMGGDKLLPAAAGINADSKEGEAIARLRREIFAREYLPTVKPTRGAHQLLEWLRDENLKVVVATSAEPEEVHDLLSIVNATKLVDAETSSGDVERSKPDPDVVHVALERTRCAPTKVVMIGDTPYDIEAARRAGIGVIALRCGGWRDTQLAGALAIYDDPQDLLDHYALSPFKHASPSPAVPHTA